MGIFGEYANKLIDSQNEFLNEEQILQEVSFTTNNDPIRIDSYQPNTYKASMIGVPKGAYMEIYDHPSFSAATKVLRVNICFGWIITNHKPKKGKAVWKNVDMNTAKLINSLLDRVYPDGTTMYSNILAYYNLPLDWPKPDFTKMVFEPSDSEKDKIEKLVLRKIEVARKEREEKERKEALRKKYYGDY